MIIAMLPRVLPDGPGWTYFFNGDGRCVNVVYGSPKVYISPLGRFAILMQYDDKETILYADRITIAHDESTLPGRIKFDKGIDPWPRESSDRILAGAYSEMANE